MIRLVQSVVSRFSVLNYNFIANLPTDVEELRTHVAKFADEEVAPLADQSDKDN